MYKLWRVSIEIGDFEISLPPCSEEDAYKIMDVLREVYGEEKMDVGLEEVLS